jgi:TolA-binding protein
MKNQATCPDDLLVLARRGELSQAGQRQLEVYLQASPISRVLYDLGCHYDTLDTDQPKDGALIERVVARASERRGSSPKQQRARGPLQLVAIVLLGFVSAGVAAATASHLVSRSSAPDTTEVRTSAPAARAVRSSPSAPASVEQVDTEMPPAVPIRAPLTPQATARSRAPSANAVQALESAADRFSEANRLRKAGRLGDAERAYRQLQRTHGGSPEAAVSHVLLGRILLRQSRPGVACSEFERYLARNPGGNLAEDALQGQAMGLRALGRRAEESNVWKTLLRRFPSSIYARVARERLEELGPSSASTTAGPPALVPKARDEHH